MEEDVHYSEYRMNNYIKTTILGGYEKYSEGYLLPIKTELNYFCLLHTSCETMDDLKNLFTRFNHELFIHDVNFIICCLDLTYIGIFSTKPIDNKIMSKIKLNDKNMNIQYNICYNAEINLFDKINEMYPILLSIPAHSHAFQNSCFYKKLHGIRNENNS